MLLSFLRNVYATFLNAGLLTSEGTEVVKLSTTHLTMLVDFDAFDSRRFDWEDTFNTNVTRHLANRETLLVLMTRNLDDNATIELNALFVAFDNLVSYGDCVTSLEFGE